MSTLNKETNGPWSLAETTSKAGTVTYNFNTAGTFVDRNIGLSVTTPAGSATTPTNSTALSSTSTKLSSTTLTVQASVTPTITEGWVSSGTAGTVKISGTVPTETKAASASGDIVPTSGKLLSKVTVKAGVLGSTAGVVDGENVTLSDTNNSGISITGSGKGNVTTAGWIAVGAASNASSQTKYLNGVTLVKPTSGERSFAITLPDGDNTVTFTFKVDSNNNVWVE